MWNTFHANQVNYTSGNLIVATCLLFKKKTHSPHYTDSASSILLQFQDYKLHRRQCTLKRLGWALLCVQWRQVQSTCQTTPLGAENIAIKSFRKGRKRLTARDELKGPFLRMEEKHSSCSSSADGAIISWRTKRHNKHIQSLLWVEVDSFNAR